jgi:hypothetical protein
MFCFDSALFNTFLQPDISYNLRHLKPDQLVGRLQRFEQEDVQQELETQYAALVSASDSLLLGGLHLILCCWCFEEFSDISQVIFFSNESIFVSTSCCSVLP